MNSPQTELFEQPRHAEDADTAWLENVLKAARGWLTSKDILCTTLGQDVTDGRQRWLRELASGSAWIISGQRGYKHIEHATAQEVEHAANWLESQAKKMSERAGGIRRNAHKIFAR